MSSCYLCGGKSSVCIHSGVRDIEEIGVLRCSNCGLVFLSSFDHLTDDFYESGKMHDWNREKWDDWLKETEKDDYRRIIHIRKILQGHSLLDFGCGNCQFLAMAQGFTSDVAGIEPDRTFEPYIEQDLKELGISVYGSLAELPDRKFDVITMFHVLEHLVDPISVLTQLKNLLTEKGKIIIETPNSDDALLSLYQCKAFADFTYWGCHARLYNAHTLELLLGKIGLIGSVEQIQRYSLANHLYWLANGRPGGHKVWDFMDSCELNSLYQSKLSERKACDTLFGVFYK